MAVRIPVEQAPTVTPRTGAPDDYLRVHASPADFGGTVAQALQAGSQALKTTEQATGNAALQQAQLADQTAGAEITTGTSAKAGDLAADFFSKTGNDAVKAFPAFQQNLKALQQDAISQATNPQMKAMVGQDVAYRLSYMMGRGAEWSAEQGKRAAIVSTKARADQSAQDAVQDRNNPHMIAHDLANGAAAIAQQNQITGADPAETKVQVAQYLGKSYTLVVRNLIADHEPIAAQALFDSVRKSLDPESQARISEELKAPVDDQIASGIVAGFLYHGSLTIPATATGGQLSNAVMTVESGGRQFGPDGAPLTSDKGAVGLMQIEPGTGPDAAKAAGLPWDPKRLASDPSYNRALGEAYLHEQVTRFGPTLGVAAYNAGPGAVENAIKEYGDPRTGAITMADFLTHLPTETQNYVRSVRANLAARNGEIGASLAAAPIDPAKFMERVDTETQGLDPDTRMRVQAKALEMVRRSEALHSQARAQVQHTIKQIGPQLLSGEAVSIPADEIKGAYPPDQANQIIGDLNAYKTAGQMLKGVQFATPEQVQQDLQDVTRGQGLISTSIRRSAGFLLGPKGKLNPKDQTADFTIRAKIANMLVEKVHQREAALKTDPAQYALADPNVAEDWKAAQSGDDPQAFAAYATATDALQGRLGVPQGSRYLLPSTDAKSIVSNLLNMDPSKVDMGGEIDKLANQYGAHWPQVFHQLVVQQHLPPEWQTVAAMDQPSQAGARTDLVRALQAVSAKGGRSTFSDSLGKGVTGRIKDAISTDPEMRSWVHTMSIPGWSGNAETIGDVEKSVNTLAEYYTMQGAVPEVAAQKAIQGVIGDKYDFDGTARIPKGSGAMVRTAEVQAEKSLSADALSPKYGGDSPEAKARLQSLIDVPKLWITNGQDNGLIMAYRRNDGLVMPVIGKDGEPISIKFADLGRGSAAIAAADPNALDSGAAAVGANP